MKKYLFIALAAIAVLSSCSKESPVSNEENGKEAQVFTATMEDGITSKATFDQTNKCALWEVGDIISIDGHEYTAAQAGASSTFTGSGATESTHHAYFPASLYNSDTPTLPAEQTYVADKFNMPMYAESSSLDLSFKNLCAVLAIKVTNEDIATLKAIKVASDQKMNGSFTVIGNKAVINDENGTKEVVLASSSALSLSAEGTTFYIAIPAQNYKYLNIFLSSDGTTYTQAMATKKAAGLGDIARNTIFNIDYAKNAIRLWETGNIFFADRYVGASSATAQGTAMAYTAAETFAWGDNWCIPSKDQMEELLNAATSSGSSLVSCSYTAENSVYGFKFTGKETGYTSNSVFFPFQNGSSNGGTAICWSTSANGDNAYCMKLMRFQNSWSSEWLEREKSDNTNKYLVRPVLKN